MRGSTSNAWLQLILKHIEGRPYTFRSQLAHLMLQEMIIKFKMGFDPEMNETLQLMLEGKPEGHEKQHSSEMYSDCYLMRVELGASRRITEESYYTLLAALHCIMIQLSQLFDASLIMLEPPGCDYLIAGFALMSYQYLVTSQFFKRRDARLRSLKVPPIDLSFHTIDQVLTNEV